MKITLNNEDLRMTVLKQIVNNASLSVVIERDRNFIDRILPCTNRNRRLNRLRVRGDRLQLFETSLSKNKSEMVEIDFKDVGFIYEGLT